MRIHPRRLYLRLEQPGQSQSALGPSWVGNRGSPDLGPELQKKIVDGGLEEVDGRSVEELSQERDTLIMDCWNCSRMAVRLNR